MENNKKSVLFICTQNSCRSQIAEAFLNSLYGTSYKAYSAGVEKTKVNPYAVEVMKEIGIDMSNHYSKTVEEFKDETFDIVVTVCNTAKETCPFFPGNKIIHKSFDDPSMVEGDIDDILTSFRKTREDIRKWIGVVFEK